MTDTGHTNNQKLRHLIEKKVTSIQTETKHKKADEIRLAIEFHLENWLKGSGSLDPKYKVSELIPVGSYAEGTKIIQPDEFDYLAVIEELSKPGAVVTDSGKDELKNNLVTVALADNTLKCKWNMLCSKDGNLQCFQRVNFPKSGNERFGHVFIRCLRENVLETYHIANKDNQSAYVTPFSVECNIPLPTVNNISLVLKSAAYETPNVFIEFMAGNLKITVDLSPAIRYFKIEDCFKVENCCGQAFADLVVCRNSLLLVGTSKESDFKVTVTEAEVEYMRSVMKPEHKLIYILLKYIKHLFVKDKPSFQTFTSYMLKTVCIHHDISCKTKERSLTECMKEVIDDLDKCRGQKYVVSAVNRLLHLDMPTFPDETLDTNRKCMIDGMRKMFRLPEAVDSVESFDEFLNKMVKQGQQKQNDSNFLCS